MPSLKERADLLWVYKSTEIVENLLLLVIINRINYITIWGKKWFLVDDTTLIFAITCTSVYNITQKKRKKKLMYSLGDLCNFVTVKVKCYSLTVQRVATGFLTHSLHTNYGNQISPNSSFQWSLFTSEQHISNVCATTAKIRCGCLTRHGPFRQKTNLYNKSHTNVSKCISIFSAI